MSQYYVTSSRELKHFSFVFFFVKKLDKMLKLALALAIVACTAFIGEAAPKYAPNCNAAKIEDLMEVCSLSCP